MPINLLMKKFLIMRTFFTTKVANKCHKNFEMLFGSACYAMTASMFLRQFLCVALVSRFLVGRILVCYCIGTKDMRERCGRGFKID